MALEFQLPSSNHTGLASLDSPANHHHHLVKIPTRSRSSKPPTSAIGLLSVAVATFCRCGSQRRRNVARRATAPRPDTADSSGVTDRAVASSSSSSSGAREEARPVSRLGNVLSRFRQRRRRVDGHQDVKGVPWDHQSRGEPLVDLSSHGFPSVYGLQDFGMNWERDPRPYELPGPGVERQVRGTVPDCTPSVGKADWDTNLVGRYIPDGGAPYPAPEPSFEDTNGMSSVPSYRQTRCYDVPSPLFIVPPPPTTSISITRNHPDIITTATYNPNSPYDYYYEPYTTSSSPSPSDSKPPSLTHGSTPSTQSPQSSARSSPQPRSPVSPPPPSTRMPPASNIKAEEGGEEPPFRLPPTPTYLQSQRAPIDSDNIVCLGPLPLNISPKNMQFQPQRSRPVAVAAAAAVPRASTSHGERYQQQQQHYNHHHHHHSNSSTSSIIRRASRSTRPHRWSSDSLGSNFTVEEEEARVQAQAQAQMARGLSMLHGGQERVGGEGDMVHIPQPSARRFSFEEE